MRCVTVIGFPCLILGVANLGLRLAEVLFCRAHTERVPIRRWFGQCLTFFFSTPEATGGLKVSRWQKNGEQSSIEINGEFIFGVCLESLRFCSVIQFWSCVRSKLWLFEFGFPHRLHVSYFSTVYGCLWLWYTTMSLSNWRQTGFHDSLLVGLLCYFWSYSLRFGWLLWYRALDIVLRLWSICVKTIGTSTQSEMVFLVHMSRSRVSAVTGRPSYTMHKTWPPAMTAIRGSLRDISGTFGLAIAQKYLAWMSGLTARQMMVLSCGSWENGERSFWGMEKGECSEKSICAKRQQ